MCPAPFFRCNLLPYPFRAARPSLVPVGFVLERQETVSGVTFNDNSKSMLHQAYDCSFFTMRKPKEGSIRATFPPLLPQQQHHEAGAGQPPPPPRPADSRPS